MLFAMRLEVARAWAEGLIKGEGPLGGSGDSFGLGAVIEEELLCSYRAVLTQGLPGYLSETFQSGKG
jgi:hypothetical protein